MAVPTLPATMMGATLRLRSDGSLACAGDPACAWPAEADGLCIHHHRLLAEPFLVAMGGTSQKRWADNEPCEQAARAGEELKVSA